MQKKLTRLLTALVILLVMLAALWYARPVDVYTLGHLGEVKSISVLVSYIDEQGVKQSSDGVDLDASDPRFAPILEQAEALRFQRSPLDLVTRHFRETIVGVPVQADHYNYLLTLYDGNTPLQLQFFMDRWDYFTPSFSRNLPVQMKDAATVGSDLGKFLWDTVKPVI